MSRQTHDPTDTAAAKRLKRLGACIRSRRTDLEMTQADLADQLLDEWGKPLTQATVSRYELGGVNLTLEQVHQIEEVLQMDPGGLLTAAGYVDLKTITPHSVEAMVQADPSLDAAYRDILVNTYRNLRQASEMARITAPRRRSR